MFAGFGGSSTVRLFLEIGIRGEARRGGRRNVIGERAVGIWSFVLFVGGICLHEYEYLTGCCDESRLAKQIVLL